MNPSKRLAHKLDYASSSGAFGRSPQEAIENLVEGYWATLQRLIDADPDEADRVSAAILEKLDRAR